MLTVLLIHLLLLPAAAVAGWRIHRGPVGRRLVELAVGVGVCGLMVVGVAIIALDVGPVFFGMLQALAWILFVYLPVLLVVGAVKATGRSLRWAAAVGAIVLATIGIDAVFIEPFNLQVRRATVVVKGLKQPTRVVLLADIQTHEVGAHERRALQLAADAKPDLLLFAGDYIQAEETVDINLQRSALSEALLQSGLDPRYGAFAVQGDVDLPGWPAAFAGTHVVSSEQPIQVLGAGELRLVMLDLETSRAPLDPAVLDPEDDRPTIILGHRPDYSIGLTDAGPEVLMLAGHTHGGQVRVPGIGPLVTFSQVPREQARGISTLPGGAHLVVSAGVGLERSTAPRLRFFCPPEVWVLELVPEP